LSSGFYDMIDAVRILVKELGAEVHGTNEQGSTPLT
jgi:hypothetical protein